MNFLVSVKSVGLLVALCMPGYILRKTNMLKGDIIDGLATILLYVGTPFLTITSFSQTEFYDGLLFNMGMVVVFGLILFIGSYYISKVCFFRVKESALKRVCVAGAYMGNSAFMGIPVIQAYFPNSPEPLIYAVMFGAAFNIIAWTLLVFTLTGDRKFVSLKSAFINPAILSLVIAVPVLIFDIQIPATAAVGINFLANLTTPLAMFIVGIRFAEIRVRDLFTSLYVYMSALVKLAVVPIFSLAVIVLLKLFLPVNSTMALSLYILTAMPSASFVIVFSEKFGGDDNITAVKCVLLSSLLSIFTIPLLMLLSGFL
jgi:predicted permease